MTERMTHRRVPPFAIALGLLAWWGVHPAQGGEKDPPGDVTIRLFERLDSARIESPLRDLRPATDLNALTDPDLIVLLRESFEDFDWGFAGWPRVDGAEIVTEGEASALRLESFVDASLGWVIPVYSDAFHRFERAVRIEGKPFCDVYVVESSREFDPAVPEARQHFLSGRGSALKIHSVPLDTSHSTDGTGDGWQRGSIGFYPTACTRSLAVVFRRRAGSDGEATISAISFDDIRLEAVYPSREDRVRLLQGTHLAPTADPELGMRKAGLLLPLPSAREVLKGEPAESNYNWRNAFYAPPTTELSFDLVFPKGARLCLATGLALETPPGSAARFQVDLVQPGKEPERLIDVVREARPEGWHWEEIDLDLSGWAGLEGTLVLRSLSEKGDPLRCGAVRASRQLAATRTRC